MCGLKVVTVISKMCLLEGENLPTISAPIPQQAPPPILCNVLLCSNAVAPRLPGQPLGKLTHAAAIAGMAASRSRKQKNSGGGGGGKRGHDDFGEYYDWDDDDDGGGYVGAAADGLEGGLSGGAVDGWVPACPGRPLHCCTALSPYLPAAALSPADQCIPVPVPPTHCTGLAVRGGPSATTRALVWRSCCTVSARRCRSALRSAAAPALAPGRRPLAVAAARVMARPATPAARVRGLTLARSMLSVITTTASGSLRRRRKRWRRTRGLILAPATWIGTPAERRATSRCRRLRTCSISR